MTEPISQLRKDPVIRRWVIITPGTGNSIPKRKTEKATKKHVFCPFCKGNESKTPPEVLSYRAQDSQPNQQGWRVRVVSNKFPALHVEGNLDRKGEGMFDWMNGIGAHEVIIETPEHNLELADLTRENIEEVLSAYRDRMVDLKRDQRIRYIMVFKNQGGDAGASLEHTHSQLIATPIIPNRVKEELEECLAYYQYKERCIFCDIIHQEKKDKQRIIFENEHFISFEPFAPRFPYETWLLPKNHCSSYEDIQHNEMESLSAALHTILNMIKNHLESPPYNYILHTSPCNQPALSHYHWHFEIIPKLAMSSGFEWGTGFYINPVNPETAAKELSMLEPSK